MGRSELFEHHKWAGGDHLSIIDGQERGLFEPHRWAGGDYLSITGGQEGII